MSTSLRNCRAVPGWIKPFIQHITNGYNDINAANMAGVGSNVIRQRLGSDPTFKNEYANAHAKAKPRFGHGRY